jgi:hypothetical protein
MASRSWLARTGTEGTGAHLNTGPARTAYQARLVPALVSP